MADLRIFRPGETGRPEHAANATFEQERREVLESVVGVFSSSVSDPDEIAACNYLLKHLTGIEGSCA